MKNEYYCVLDTVPDNNLLVGIFTTEFIALKNIYEYLHENFMYQHDDSEGEEWKEYFGKREDFTIFKIKIDEGFLAYKNSEAENDTKIISSEEFENYMIEGPRNSSLNYLIKK